MKEAPYHEYLKSLEWQALREKKFAEFGKQCVVCGRTKIIHVHHRIYRRPRTLTKTSDLIVMCEEHHDELHLAHKTTGVPLKQVDEFNVVQFLVCFREKGGAEAQRQAAIRNRERKQFNIQQNELIRQSFKPTVRRLIREYRNLTIEGVTELIDQLTEAVKKETARTANDKPKGII